MLNSEEIDRLEQMIYSENKDDVVLAVQLIWNNRPFHKSRYLTHHAKSKLDEFTKKQYKFVWSQDLWQGKSDEQFFHGVLGIKTKGMKLYKIDSTGKERFLHIWNDKDVLYQESGVVGTENPVPHKKICTPKNVGKSNETTGEEQAKLEKASLIKEKLKEGYFKTLKEAKEGKDSVVLPMLAKGYKDHKDKIDWNNAYIQPKLDGMRCLAVINGENVKLISRQGTEITTVPHIVNALKGYTNGSCVLDGELYLHGVGFQENMRLIKKYRQGETEKIQYWVYDVISDESFWNRHVTIDLQTLNHPSIVEVDTVELSSEEELKLYHKDNLKDGYEGSIIRWGNAGYKIDGRSENLLKYKDFQDIALKIKDIVPAEQRPSWGKPIFELKGKEFGAGTKMSHEDREDLLVNKKDYIGKTAEIRFFEYSDEGIPRFPVMVGIREDL